MQGPRLKRRGVTRSMEKKQSSSVELCPSWIVPRHLVFEPRLAQAPDIYDTPPRSFINLISMLMPMEFWCVDFLG